MSHVSTMSNSSPKCHMSQLCQNGSPKCHMSRLCQMSQLCHMSNYVMFHVFVKLGNLLRLIYFFNINSFAYLCEFYIIIVSLIFHLHDGIISSRHIVHIRFTFPSLTAIWHRCCWSWSISFFVRPITV